MSNMPGLGAMMHYLSGGSRNDPQKYYGKKIVGAKMEISPDSYNSCGDRDRGSLLLSFDGGPSIRIWDDGQSCCEARYMTTEDNPADLIGQTLVSIEATAAEEKPRGEDDYGESHEIVFVKIQGDKSAITIATHNEHNGYYGGFGLTIDEVPA